jgi:GAF domain-containing protein
VLAEEQAALRRVATLVARGVPPEEVFAAVVEEVGRLLSADYAAMGRYEPDAAVSFVAGAGRTGRPIPVGGRWSLGGKTSPRSSSRPGVRPGSTAMPMPMGRSVAQPASSDSAQASGRRSSSRAACGV